jgi:glycosyltransferase involved in cell wall biosynthesis
MGKTNIYIFHYHLNPGGVTRIIESQIQALKKVSNYNVCLLTGHCENKLWYEKQKVTVVEDNLFNYLTDVDDLEKKYQHIVKVFHTWCTKEGVLHVHNLNLGKNPLVTLAVSEMAHDGYKVLNHAHDFAEDRPQNINFLKKIFKELSNRDYLDILYPDIINYHFATLNGYDLDRLKKKKIPESRCALLPNPVVFNQSTAVSGFDEIKNEIVTKLSLEQSKLIVTYPVRVIRRKNIAEFVLFAALYSDRANWIVTQPPKNPIEKEQYDKWTAFCKQENIKICWEAGNKVDFENLIRASDFCFTTSIQEGFGMVYMEPWLLDTPVIGRDIKMVTEDLKSAGMGFPFLYEHLYVRDGKEMHELDFEVQKQVIKEYILHPSQKEELIYKNIFLKGLFDLPSEMLIKKNKEVILKQFSLDNYSTRLNGLYQKLT